MSTLKDTSGKRWANHNSQEFWDEFGKISPEGEYRNQLRTARRVARTYGNISPQEAAEAYGVRVEDIISNVPIEQIVRMDRAQNPPKA